MVGILDDKIDIDLHVYKYIFTDDFINNTILLLFILQ